MVTRRRLLQAVAGAAIGTAPGCRASEPAPPQPTADPQADLLARLRAGEQRLLAAYDASLATHPGLRPALGPVRAHHAAHLAAVGGAAPPTSPGSPAGSVATQGAGAASATADGQPGLVPASAAGAVSALRRAELTAARDRAAQCRDAPPALAALIASIGASEAAHAALLPALTRGVR